MRQCFEVVKPIPELSARVGDIVIADSGHPARVFVVMRHGPSAFPILFTYIDHLRPLNPDHGGHLGFGEDLRAAH